LAPLQFLATNASIVERRPDGHGAAGSGMTGAYESKQLHLAILFFILVLGAVYGLTIRDGADWTDDYALYIRHAINIAEGLPYNHDGIPDFATGRVFSYPVGYPLVLAAAYSVFGLDLHVFKWINVVFLTLFAGLLIAYVRRYRASSNLTVFLLATACMANPIVWEMKDDVLSDALYLLLSFLSLCVYEELRCEQRFERSERLVRMAVLSLALVGAYATRAVGVVLPISILVLEVVRYRRIHLSTAVILLPFAGFFLLQQFVEGSFPGYVRDSTVTGVATIFDPWRWVMKANNYRWLIAGFFSSNKYPMLDTVLFHGLIVAPAAVGYVSRFVRGLSVLEVYAAGYIALFMIAHVGNYERYFVPLFVLLLIYAVEGIAVLSARVRVDARYASSIVLALLLGAYGVKYSTIRYDDLYAEGIDHPSARALFHWVESETDKADVLALQKAFGIGLMTGRRAGQLPLCRTKDCLMRDGDAVWGYLKRIGASYIILKKTDWKLTHYLSDKVFSEVFIEPNREYLSRAYDNPDFSVMRIVRFPAAM